MSNQSLAEALEADRHPRHAKPPTYKTVNRCMRRLFRAKLTTFGGKAQELNSHIVATAFAEAFELHVRHGHLAGVGPHSWAVTLMGDLIYDVWAPPGFIREAIIITTRKAKRIPYQEISSSEYDEITKTPQFADAVRQVSRILKPIAEAHKKASARAAAS